MSEFFLLRIRNASLNFNHPLDRSLNQSGVI